MGHPATTRTEATSQEVFERVRTHDFHPLEAPDLTFTIDRNSGHHGVADLDDTDGRVRLLAIRDLVRLGADAAGSIAKGLEDDAHEVRSLAAAALGIMRAKEATGALERLAQHDPQPIVRCYAMTALGDIGATESLPMLGEIADTEQHRDTRHMSELAIGQIEKQMPATDAQVKAYLALDETTFGTQRTGASAADVQLEDTRGERWDLADSFGRSWTALVWIFADWCPVCHGEFAELMELRQEFEDAGVRLATVECHDTFCGRVMVGKEIQSKLWTSRSWSAEAYTKRIWWPHLLDRAGSIGAVYGANPMAFAVHGEYINRPTTVIIDPDGIVRWLYRGTFWGDRPSIVETLEMIRSETFDFRHPQRLEPNRDSAPPASS